MRFLDTDTLLRYFTRDDERKASAVLELLLRIDSGEEKVTTSAMVIFELVFTLQTYYRVPRAEIGELVQAILDLRGLALEHKDVFSRALELYSRRNISFADAFNACFMKKRGIEEIYTYDRDFDRIGWTRRVSP